MQHVLCKWHPCQAARKAICRPESYSSARCDQHAAGESRQPAMSAIPARRHARQGVPPPLFPVSSSSAFEGCHAVASRRLSRRTIALALPITRRYVPTKRQRLAVYTRAAQQVSPARRYPQTRVLTIPAEPRSPGGLTRCRRPLPPSPFAFLAFHSGGRKRARWTQYRVPQRQRRNRNNASNSNRDVPAADVWSRVRMPLWEGGTSALLRRPRL